MLTKPSKGVKNDGYDNEDSDYILYVNDILGSEDAGHKCVYYFLSIIAPVWYILTAAETGTSFWMYWARELLVKSSSAKT